MSLHTWDTSLAVKTQHLQRPCLCNDTGWVGNPWSSQLAPGVFATELPTLYAEKENKWHCQTSQASTPPFMVTVAAGTAWGCTCAQRKEFGHLCPVVTSCCRLPSARQKVLPRGTSAVAANCRHCCSAPIAVTTLCSLSCKLTELCFKSWQVALPLLNWLKGSFVDSSNPV